MNTFLDQYTLDRMACLSPRLRSKFGDTVQLHRAAEECMEAGAEAMHYAREDWRRPESDDLKERLAEEVADAFIALHTAAQIAGYQDVRRYLLAKLARTEALVGMASTPTTSHHDV